MGAVPGVQEGSVHGPPTSAAGATGTCRELWPPCFLPFTPVLNTSQTASYSATSTQFDRNTTGCETINASLAITSHTLG